MKENIVIIPTYNEKENIEDIIRTVFSLSTPFNILIVDDGSPDGTAQIVKNLQLEFTENLFIIERAGKQGLGTAYIAGFKWSLVNGFDYIYEMDADFSHNPKDLENLYQACKNGSDVAIGSRYKSGVNVVNWPMSRILLSYCASKYVRFVTRMNINDTTAGFVCYSRKVLESINLNRIKMTGYGFQIEMKFKAWILKYKIEEVNIIFTDRQKGKSKMSGGIIGEAFFGVMKMKIKSKLSKKNFLK
ncbi:MAG: polyprenol monophosphomannose synthase [Bacteroidales bacterium]|jgi:dolichol-phosphate mannosyltransferase|nr:polyprenol monophosphomannose synthase [Bacteroidales bacterium]